MKKQLSSKISKPAARAKTTHHKKAPATNRAVVPYAKSSASKPRNLRAPAVYEEETPTPQRSALRTQRSGGRKRSTKTALTATEERARHVALAIAQAALDKKATDVEILNVIGRVDYADYVVVLSGRSDRQVSAIAHYIQEHLKKTEGERCLSVEGLAQGMWVLMDFGDVIVHIFHEQNRGYYDLESLFMDAERLLVNERKSPKSLL